MLDSARVVAVVVDRLTPPPQRSKFIIRKDAELILVYNTTLNYTADLLLSSALVIFDGATTSKRQKKKEEKKKEKKEDRKWN